MAAKIIIAEFPRQYRGNIAPFLLALQQEPNLKNVRVERTFPNVSRIVAESSIEALQLRHVAILHSAWNQLRAASAPADLVDSVHALLTEAEYSLDFIGSEKQRGAVLSALQACADRNTSPYLATLAPEFAKLADYVLTPVEV